LLRAAEERTLRAQRDSRDTRHRLEGAEAELERVSWELQQWREDADDNDRLLRDTRAALRKEQASHVSAKAIVRESQREVQRLASQLKSQEAEDELAASELHRFRSDLAEQEAEKQRLQLQLQAREAELGQLRSRQKSNVHLHDADLRSQRLTLVEREEVLGGRERFLDEREQLAGEAEALIRQQRQHLRSEVQRAELAGLRATVTELAQPLTVAPKSRRASGERSRSNTGGRRGGGAAWPICSSDDSFVPKDMLKLDLEGTVPTPSSSSATSPEGAPPLPQAPAQHDDCGMGGKADVGAADHARNARAPLVAPLSWEAPSASRAAAAVAAGELPEFLRGWRKDLRREHSALEEDRRLWRAEARRVKRRGEAVGSEGGSKNTAEVEILGEVRAALDARAAVLNSSIGEYRALERLHASKEHRRQRSHSTGASRNTAGSRVRASSTSALGQAPSLAAPSFGDGMARGCGLAGSMKVGAQEEDLLQRWQHMLQPSATSQVRHSTFNASCRAVPPLSGRAALLNLHIEGSSAIRAGAGGA